MKHKSDILYLWQNGLFDCPATYSDGERYEVVSSGLRIEGSAIDFTHAVLRNVNSGATLTGSIKVDVASSDWSVDDRLANGSGVILHVVLNANSKLFVGGTPLLTCCVTPSQSVKERFEKSRTNCVARFIALDDVYKESIIERLVIERLDRKAKRLAAFADNCDWSEAAYVGLMSSMGYGSNRVAFEKIAQSLPLHYLEHHFDREQVLEALFLGQAGFLRNIDEPDEYTQDLMQEYINAQEKSSVVAVPIVLKRSTRVHSGPAISLVRAAHILSQTENLLDNIVLARDIGDLREMFTIALPSYWCDHTSPSCPTTIRGLDYVSESKIDLLLINFVAPLLVGYGRAHNLGEFVYKAIDLLERVKCENNRYVRRFTDGGYCCRSAYVSQGLIELSGEYCTRASCSTCPLF